MQVRYPDVHVHITGEYPCGYDGEENEKIYSVKNSGATGIIPVLQ